LVPSRTKRHLVNQAKPDRTTWKISISTLQTGTNLLRGSDVFGPSTTIRTLKDCFISTSRATSRSINNADPLSTISRHSPVPSYRLLVTQWTPAERTLVGKYSDSVQFYIRNLVFHLPHSQSIAKSWTAGKTYSCLMLLCCLIRLQSSRNCPTLPFVQLVMAPHSPIKEPLVGYLLSQTRQDSPMLLVKSKATIPNPFDPKLKECLALSAFSQESDNGPNPLLLSAVHSPPAILASSTEFKNKPRSAIPFLPRH
jgi:hypothetical protein